MTSSSWWHRITRGFVWTQARADWGQSVGQASVSDILDVPITDRFHAKQGRSTGRWILENSQGRISVYLKRHWILPRWRGLLAALWPNRAWSPAKQEWQHLAWAQAQGIPVPEPVAVGEILHPWGRLQSYLAVEELAGMIPLHEAIPRAANTLPPWDFDAWKAGILSEMARLVHELHARRAFHKDLYLCHFYLAEDDIAVGMGPWRGRIWLIDLHRLGVHRWSWPLWRLKDLAQLYYSSKTPGVTGKDRIRFWHEYLSDSPRSLWNRITKALIVAKGERYYSHNTRRRQQSREEAP